MLWVQGFNKHIVQDMEGEYIATFKDAYEAAAQVRLHNVEIAKNEAKKVFNVIASESIDTRLASSNGWTNHLPTGGRK